MLLSARDLLKTFAQIVDHTLQTNYQNLNASGRDRLRSANNEFHISGINRREVFFVPGRRKCNALPAVVRNTAVSAFKNIVKTHLFKIAHSDT